MKNYITCGRCKKTHNVGSKTFLYCKKVVTGKYWERKQRALNKHKR